MTVQIDSPHPQLFHAGSVGTDHTSLKSYIIFRVDAQFYALPLVSVTRILRMVALTPLPDAPPWVLGVVNIAGHILSAISLRDRLGLPYQKPGIHHRLLVTDTAVWIVDEVFDVLELESAQLEPLPAALIQSRYLTGVLQYKDHLVLLLNITGLLPEGGF